MFNEENMENKEEFTVGGYTFISVEDAELAKSEAKKISYIEGHTDMNNISVIKSVYSKALEERYFQTPIGFEYMRKLQKRIVDSEESAENVKPIPLYISFRHVNLSEAEPVKKRTSKAKKVENELRVKYRNACLIATIFAVMAVVMFLISLNGTTVNAYNYKAAVTNTYAEWEAELTERENAVREKERELNIIP